MAAKHLGKIDITLSVEDAEKFVAQVKVVMNANSKLYKGQLVTTGDLGIDPAVYETQPDPLPERLPAGVEGVLVDRHWKAITELVLELPSIIQPHYNGIWVDVGGQSAGTPQSGGIPASLIDWKTVPIQFEKATLEPEHTFAEQAVLTRKALDEAQAAVNLPPLIGPIQEPLIQLPPLIDIGGNKGFPMFARATPDGIVYESRRFKGGVTFSIQNLPPGYSATTVIDHQHVTDGKVFVRLEPDPR